MKVSQGRQMWMLSLYQTGARFLQDYVFSESGWESGSDRGRDRGWDRGF
jgi:hypothetical protein